jgi:DNA-binding PadR family transcriptional regulator
MFRDKTLIPTEAIRLLALGLLAEAPRGYAELAVEVRRFIGHVLGPSLDMLAPSIELLRAEGLATGTETLTLAEPGRAELAKLLSAPIRAPLDDTGRLVVALKLRFMGALAPAERQAQYALLQDVYETERARLLAFRGLAGAASAELAAWLDHEIGEIDRRLAHVAERAESGGERRPPRRAANDG